MVTVKETIIFYVESDRHGWGAKRCYKPGADSIAGTNALNLREANATLTAIDILLFGVPK